MKTVLPEFLLLPALLLMPESSHAYKPTGVLSTVKVPASSSEILVDIYIPSAKKINGDILVLPGWKFSRTRWHKETELLSFADKYAYRCIFPEMNTSCYESVYFPETRLKWSPIPGGAWVRDALIPYMRKNHGIFADNGLNCVMGLSTGGRGVALVSLQNPGLFKAGAALSGDFNQLAMPNDNLMAALYGNFSAFRERRRSTDTPFESAKEGKWSMPLYIGHGGKDHVVPFSQSLDFYKLLSEKYPDIKIVFHQASTQGHDFAYWGSELQAVFDFFESIRKAN
ncbi:MAG: prolyl oligopeptidase family serine peptidase [Spirochaetia bacterium]|jgi:hypothetical protein|nr:prolyl oligopeptidase family serine peptidase [Spirochaetia bacterium]